jgi:hypothetical protein
MDESQLNNDLQALSGQRIPDLLSDLNESVFARIRVMESTTVKETLARFNRRRGDFRGNSFNAIMKNLVRKAEREYKSSSK